MNSHAFLPINVANKVKILVQNHDLLRSQLQQS